MIPFNVAVDKFNKHPKAGRYGVVIGGANARCPVTIVDNSESKKKQSNGDEPVLVLLRLAEDVRRYSRMQANRDFGYLFFHEALPEPTYRMYDYPKQELSDEEIIRTLKRVVYGIQPRLYTQTCLSWTSRQIEDDPSRYTGIYMLNDEKQYKIQKTMKAIKIWKMTDEEAMKNEANPEYLLVHEELDIELYKKARKLVELRRKIVEFGNEFLDKGEESLAVLQEYYRLKNELDDDLKGI